MKSLGVHASIKNPDQKIVDAHVDAGVHDLDAWTRTFAEIENCSRIGASTIWTPWTRRPIALCASKFSSPVGEETGRRGSVVASRNTEHCPKSLLPVSVSEVAYPIVLLAIDPGADSGWAIFFGGMLIGCGLGDRPAPSPKTGDRFRLVVVEHPVIYPGGRTANPNDIVKVAISAGEWAGRFRRDGSEIRYVTPREWKGTINPDICNARTWARLDDGERMIVDDAVREQRIPARKRHNMLDAIGLGLFASGRK